MSFNKEFTMDISSKDIYFKVTQLLKDVKILTRDELDEKYSDFITKFPKLYNTCLNDPDQESILKNLKKMLETRERTLKGELSSVKANAFVGEFVAEKYLYPSAGVTPRKLTEAEKKEYIKKLEKEKLEKRVENNQLL